MSPPDVIPDVKNTADWNRLSKCPRCAFTEIESKGERYHCKRCGYTLKKARCPDCNSIRMYVSRMQVREEVTFVCIDCKGVKKINVERKKNRSK